MRQEQAEATRNKLLESAQKMFAEKGFKGTSVRMINRSVNLADGLLYHYFPGGKKEIFQVIVLKNMKEIQDDLENTIMTELDINMSLQEILEIGYVGFINVIDKHLDIIRILAREDEIREIVSKADICKLAGEREPWLSVILQKKYKRGEIEAFDYDMASFSMNSILINHVLIKIVGIGKSKIESAEGRKQVIDYQVKMWSKSSTDC